jgi:hypothetical protein
MARKSWILLFTSIFTGLFICLAYLYGMGYIATASAAQLSETNAPLASNYRILAWKYLGMHCYNQDFADLAVLPPYNTLWAQVVLAGPCCLNAA